MATASFDRVFEERILPSRYLARAVPVAEPTVVFIAGQPGAGKSTTRAAILKQVGVSKDNFADVDTDNFRQYDVLYQLMVDRNPRGAAATRHDVASGWTELALKHVLKCGLNAVVSCTLRSEADAVAKVSPFLHSESPRFRVVVAIGTTHESQSRLSILLRFHDALARRAAGMRLTEEPRLVPSEVHRTCYTGLLETAEWLESALSSKAGALELFVWSRDGTVTGIDRGLWREIQERRLVPWTAESIKEFLRRAIWLEDAVTRSLWGDTADAKELTALLRAVLTDKACVPRHLGIA
jgi:UDP-N-acetylglucosamine kinase